MSERLKGNHVTIERSPIGIIGCKTRLIQKHRLWEFFPRSYYEVTHKPDSHVSRKHVYAELFCGSSVMFFNLKPTPLFAILNDIDEEIYNFWKVMRDNYEELSHKLEYSLCGTSWLKEYENDPTDVNRALAFYIRNKMRISHRGQQYPSPIEFYQDISKWKKKFAESRVQVWNLDFKDCMKKFNAMKVREEKSCTVLCIYEDPPYYGTEYFYKDKSFDHDTLSKLNHESEHQIILSYNDCEKVRQLYHDWYKLDLVSTSKMDKTFTNELLLSNWPLKRHTKENLSSQTKVI